MNNLLFMKAKTYTFAICLLLLTTVACKKEAKFVNVPTNKKIETFYISELNSCISLLDSISTTRITEENISLYKKARKHFKTIEKKQ